MTQILWGMIKIMVITAFFGVSSGEQPLSLVQVVSYIWLGQALLGMLPWNTDHELVAQIREGGVAYELIRPLDLYWFWFCRTITLRTATTALRSMPMIIFAVWVLPLVGLSEWILSPPADLLTLGVFLISLLAEGAGPVRPPQGGLLLQPAQQSLAACGVAGASRRRPAAGACLGS